MKEEPVEELIIQPEKKKEILTEFIQVLWKWNSIKYQLYNSTVSANALLTKISGLDLKCWESFFYLFIITYTAIKYTKLKK